MKISISKIGNHRTISFAAKELARLLKTMDNTTCIDIKRYETYDSEIKNCIWLGLDGTIAESLDDTISIKVKNGSGIITGSNECSVLIGVYRFAYELGCRFLRPGMDGEKIPSKKLSPSVLDVEIEETAYYRHRAVCIEGSVSYEHVYNMIDWLPKVGMSGYFVQFFAPTGFFERYYSRFYSDPADPEYGKNLTDADVNHMWAELEDEIVKRGLKYHTIGHGWTCAPFGIDCSSGDRFDGIIPEETKQYFAMLNGKREMHNNPLHTNLCYSNPAVRNRITDSITDYCKTHPQVDYLHFWLADGTNNHCECENCKDVLPSDYYVMMLNDLNKKLTEAGIDTKIVCLIYMDLLWEPEIEKIENPDRFVLMFAPITRSYSATLSSFDREQPVNLPPYNRNKNEMPYTVAENVKRLEKWQDIHLADDSFDFDYHLMWDHHFDPGYYNVAKLLHKDMVELELVGLNGMVSCQLQRTAFPTALPLYSMAKGLWDKESKFEDISAEYFAAAFGDDGEKVEEYLRTVSDLFDPVYLRSNKTLENSVAIKNITEAKNIIVEFCNNEISKKCNTSSDWKYLECHAEMMLAFADAMIAKLSGNDDEYQRHFAEFKNIVVKNAAITDTVLDDSFIINDVSDILNRHHA